MSIQASTSVKVEEESSENKIMEKPEKDIIEERPQSPDNNCPICLDDLSNKSFTNSCLHPFCYSCIMEWAKIKAECPLCKQRFTSIIHNIRSISDYDEQPLEQRLSLDSSHFFFNLAIQQIRDRDNLMLLWSQQQLGVPTFTAPPTTPEFRRGIYRQGLWVRTSSSDRRRQCSPEFYRNNPAQTHRLIPWLTRELNILLHVGMPVHTVCSEIISLTMLYPITSPTFKRHITSHLGPRTDHFLHEFYNFAIAPESNMHLYDFNAVYASPPYAPIRRRVIPRPFRDFLNLTEDSTGDELVPVVTRARNSNHGSGNDSDTVIVLSDDSDSEPTPPTPLVHIDSDVEVLEVLPPRSLRPCDVITIDTDSDVDESVRTTIDITKSDRSKRNRRYSQDQPRPSTSFQAYSDTRKSKRERKSSTSSIESIPSDTRRSKRERKSSTSSMESILISKKQDTRRSKRERKPSTSSIESIPSDTRRSKRERKSSTSSIESILISKKQDTRRSKRERKSSTSSIESIPISKKTFLWNKSSFRHRSTSSSRSSSTRTSSILSSLSSRESSPVNYNRKIKKSRRRRNRSYSSSSTDSQYNNVPVVTRLTGRKLKSVVHLVKNVSDSDFSNV